MPHDEIAERDWTDTIDAYGLSISTPYERAEFLAERESGVPPFGDPSNAVAPEYGIVHDLDGMADVTEPRPAPFLLRGDLTVEYARVAAEHPAFPPYDEIEGAIADL
ncbi:hypothetical protein BRD17_08750 [Halobacteriales archaeon SW_7_68_16]|nr:MAG: hypothetical protein BRD17_08750 [Halobacteriales archaeon SW_7_68_16]